MPRWVYSPEHDYLYVSHDVFGNDSHDKMANTLYDHFDDVPNDERGWPKWWGGVIEGGSFVGQPIGYTIDYTPFEQFKAGFLNADYRTLLPEYVKAKIEAEVEKYKKMRGAKFSATIVVAPPGIEDYYVEPLIAVPDEYDAEYWMTNPVTAAASTFGYIGGHLILAKTHHQGIMAAMMGKGWTWEHFFELPQMWGWIHVQQLTRAVPPSYDVAIFDEQMYVVIQGTSDSGTQNKELIPDLLKAFADTYHLKAVISGGIHGVWGAYGGGLTGNPSRAEDPANQERRQESILNTIPLPPGGPDVGQS